MIVLVWLFAVICSCVGYLFWIDNVSILTRPNELGDFISGVAALASLPSILLILLDTKRTQALRVKQEKEANNLRQFQAFMTIHEALNSNFESYLSALGFYLESAFPKRRKQDKFHNPEDVIGYLRSVHFSQTALPETLAVLKEETGLKFVAKEFVVQVQTFIALAQQAHYLDDDMLQTILTTHPCYTLYGCLKEVV